MHNSWPSPFAFFAFHGFKHYKEYLVPNPTGLYLTLPFNKEPSHKKLNKIGGHSCSNCNWRELPFFFLSFSEACFTCLHECKQGVPILLPHKIGQFGLLFLLIFFQHYLIHILKLKVNKANIVFSCVIYYFKNNDNLLNIQNLFFSVVSLQY